MGKKKRFIDKKNAESDERKNGDARRREQKACGVFFDDNYDYLQHLRQRTPAHLEPLPENITVIEAKKPDKKKIGNFVLPGEAFASQYEEKEGLLNLAASVPGPRPDWDPDIVAALDDALDLDDEDNILEDDFIMIANAEADVTSEDPSKFQWSHGISEERDYSSDDDSLNFGVDDDNYDDREAMSQYSMSSSVIRRTEGLCLLDDRFDKIMEEYEDDEIGALDQEEVGGDKSLNDPILQSITNELCDQVDVESRKSVKPKVTFAVSDQHCVEMKDSVNEETEDDDGFIKITETPAREQWDCESILSTYSNLYNHPTLIKEESHMASPGRKIALSRREGIPIGVLSDGKKEETVEGIHNVVVVDDDDDEETASDCHVRPRGETREEKKCRKQAVKQERQARRAEKKTNKLLFKEERKRQEKCLSNSALLVGQKIQ